jgi:hypothetical protein
MRKPENRDKFKVALAAIIQFYGRRDVRMVAEVLSEEAEKAKALAEQRERNRTNRTDKL